MPWSKIKAQLNEPDFQDEMPKGARRLEYPIATREALDLAMAVDPAVFVMGQGVDDPGGTFGTTKGLHTKYGSDRVFDTPLAETGLTGIATGAAMAGMRPVYIHNRPDFLLLAMDQLVNHASKWHYMFGGAVQVPLVIWACIGRGWGSAAQHSQALQGLFMHIPGLKLVMPGTAFDAKGLMLSAIADPNPVLILDHRYNFRHKGMVPEGIYNVPFGKGAIRCKGRDLTIISISHMAMDAFNAAQSLSQMGIEAEVIDLRSLRPWDEELVLSSVAKTGRAIVADCGWRTGGITAEIAATISEKAFDSLKAPVKRVACPDLPTPAGYTLEEAFYVGADDIKETALAMMQK